MTSIEFGKWFRPIVEASGLKKKVIAEAADIDPVSLSRILNGAQGVSISTAVNLAGAINSLSGRTVAEINTARSLAAGMTLDAGSPEGLFHDLQKLPSDRQELAKRQIRAIIDTLSEEEQDTNYIDDEENGR
jgi:transcriptional regulator with XRE-family HTH domain